MAYDGAEAELIGTEHQGLALMFTMMNAARLQVGVEGVAIAERAWQGALAYARDRKQGRSAISGENPAPIIDHPDIRRMLMSMKARIEAARAICLSTAVAADLAKSAKTEEAREAAKLREELLTPIAKAWCTDIGVAVASEALQIHGGMGYIEETGAAQHYRDARILPIYEGTNAIQAMDLAGRKLSLAGGKAAGDLFGDIGETVRALKAHGRFDGIAAALESGLAAAQMTSGWLTEQRGKADALAGATMFMKLMGDVTGGWMLAKAALADEKRPGGRGKTTLAHVYASQVLAQAPGLAAAVTMGADVLSDMAVLETQ
jgi:hypothetical protein